MGIIPDNLLMVLKVEEILEDQKQNPEISVSLIANLLQQGIVLDGDYYRPVPKDQFILDLLKRFGNEFKK